MFIKKKNIFVFIFIRHLTFVQVYTFTNKINVNIIKFYLMNTVIYMILVILDQTVK